MANDKIQLLTKQQKARLKQLFDLATDKDEALTLTEFEGFLFGLAITPEVILPSEWLVEVFGEEMVTFDSEEQANTLMKELMGIYNIYVRAFHEGTLRFPFDMEKLSVGMLGDIRDWAFGLLEALSMRPEIWYLDREEDYEKAPEDIKDVILSSCIVCGVSDPEEGRGLLERQGKPLDEVETQATLLELLPAAVENLQAHAARLQNKRHGHHTPDRSSTKISRNDPCPCGSGKKYKKCCGMN